MHVDCAALPKDLIEAELFGHEKGAFTHAHTARTGLVEAAEDGTVYLDEIGELPSDLQSRLLSVLERREVRRIGSTRPRPVAAWFIAATNRDLDQMVSTGAFRSDLYFRLKVLSLHIPSLRERLGDLAPLFEHFAALTARRYGMPAPEFSPEILERHAATTGRATCGSLRTWSSAQSCSARIAVLDIRASASRPHRPQRPRRPPPRLRRHPDRTHPGGGGAPAHRDCTARDRRERVGVRPAARRVPNGASLPHSQARTRPAGPGNELDSLNARCLYS